MGQIMSDEGKVPGVGLDVGTMNLVAARGGDPRSAVCPETRAGVVERPLRSLRLITQS